MTITGYSESIDDILYFRVELMQRKNTVLIKKVWRTNKYDRTQQVELASRVRWMEDSERKIRAITIGNRTFNVANPNRLRNYLSYAG